MLYFNILLFFEGNMSDTICAITTPLGTGGVSIIRVSGPNSKSVMQKIFVPFGNVKNIKSRYMYFGKVQFEDFCDDALCVYFEGPNSYTGEDVLEINLHGGYYLTNEVLSRLLNNFDVRLANPGEFSKRAVMNGKMDISKAEGIIDMINAGSLAEVRASSNQIVGKLTQNVQNIQSMLTDLICEVDVAIDYPDQDIEYISNDEIKNKISAILQNINNLLDTTSTGMQIKSGVNVALVGVPNVGKSSLLNALLGFDRAIVTNIAGTTRDTLNETYEFNGIKFNLIDTAGLHDTNDEIEKIGISRTLGAVSDADVVLHLIDCSQPLEEQFQTKINNKNIIIVLNKQDLLNKDVQNKLNEYTKNYNINIDMQISAKNKQNIDKLKQLIFDRTINTEILSKDVLITNVRHKQLLVSAQNELNEAFSKTNTTLDCIALLLKDAWQNLGQITGEYTDDTILDRLFSKFCLGK